MGLWLLIGILLLVGAILLEGRRQRRVHGKPSGKALIGTGLLELQRHLEPDRHVEILLEAPEDLRQAEIGAPPTPADPTQPS
jgi:hypothetical protein